ncbi:MAG TPA: DUF5677 domain-containing protein [Phycisphaerae bacterium]|nr:DUF5677 domain-containing protein [Phycisphaerae bacterium]
MSVFAWRRQMTRHFGEQWVPFAELGLKGADGRWRTFAVQVDSGAVISVLTRSAAELLGIKPEEGERVELASIGRQPHPYFVHELTARIGDLGEFTMRIALSDREDMPNLLGRLDVLDHLQIDLDPSLEETRFSAPWLDADGRRIWRHLLETEAAILAKWGVHQLPSPVDEAARRFVNRAGQLVAAAAGIAKLHRDYEFPLLIRSLFELSLQFEYLMADPEDRARLYLDYEHVTKYRAEQAWLRFPGLIGRTLRDSPQRAKGEERNRAEYERVRLQFARAPKRPDQTRHHWYPGTLRDLAGQLDRIAEYEAIYGLYSAWAHGDPWTAGTNQLGHGGLIHAFAYWARVLRLIADAKGIILAADQYEALTKLATGLAVD